MVVEGVSYSSIDGIVHQRRIALRLDVDERSFSLLCDPGGDHLYSQVVEVGLVELAQ